MQYLLSEGKFSNDRIPHNVASPEQEIFGATKTGPYNPAVSTLSLKLELIRQTRIEEKD